MRQFRSATTRVLLASGVLFAAVGFADASAAQDGRDATTQPVAYRGPFLSWAGKTSAPRAPPPPHPLARPQAEEISAPEPLQPPRPAYATRSAPAQSEYSAWPA